MKLRFTACLAMLAILATITPASGASILSSILPLDSFNEIEDRNIERLLDSSGVPYENPGTIQVGDILESLIRFDNINGVLTPIAAGDLNYELLGYARLQVVAILDVFTDPDGFERGTIVLGSGFADGQTVVEIYESVSGSVYSETIAPDTAIANVRAQDLVFTAGLVSDDDFWIAPSSVLNIGFFTTDGIVASGGDYSFGVSVITNPGALPILENGISSIFTGETTWHDIVGTGNLKALAPGSNAGWDASTDTLFRFNTVGNPIPEPGSIAIWALISAGFGICAYRRRQK